MVKNSQIIQIENLRIWKSNNWVKYNTKMCDAFLRLHNDQILITTENKILESINVCSKIKGVFKQDYVILIVNRLDNEVRKIKFQIKNNVEKNLLELAKKFPLASYNKVSSSGNAPYIKFKNTEDVLKEVLDKKVDLQPLELPPSPALDHFVKLCIVDPLFLQTVKQVERVIEKEMAHNN